MCEKQTIIHYSVLQSNPYSLASEVTVVLWTRIICVSGVLQYVTEDIVILGYGAASLRKRLPMFLRNVVRSVSKIKMSRNYWTFAMFWRNVMPSFSRARGPRIVLVRGDPWRQSNDVSEERTASDFPPEAVMCCCTLTSFSWFANACFQSRHESSVLQSR